MQLTGSWARDRNRDRFLWREGGGAKVKENERTAEEKRKEGGEGISEQKKVCCGGSWKGELG